MGEVRELRLPSETDQASATIDRYSKALIFESQAAAFDAAAAGFEAVPDKPTTTGEVAEALRRSAASCRDQIR